MGRGGLGLLDRRLDALYRSTLFIFFAKKHTVETEFAVLNQPNVVIVQSTTVGILAFLPVYLLSLPLLSSLCCHHCPS